MRDDDSRTLPPESHRASVSRQETLPPRDLPPGDLPHHVGPYRILEILGEGGMGRVYLAEQTEPLRRRVAVKVVRQGVVSETTLRRFEAECQALAAMSHPNIAQVYDAGTTVDRQPYCVLEYVPGEAITRYCDRHRLSLGQRLELLVSVCRAVQHAHERGILHRDLKPSNILVVADGDRPLPKVIDFGLAKSLGAPLTEETLYTGDNLVGTPAYMSPESLEPASGDLGPRSDVYSLGVLAYELLVGARPFDDGGNAHRVAGLILTREAPPSSHRWADLGKDRQAALAGSRQDDPSAVRRYLEGAVDRILAKALAREGHRRYESAGALAADLERARAGHTVEAPSLTSSRRLEARGSRSWVPAAVGGLFLLLAVVVAMVFFFPDPLPPMPKVESLAVLPLKNFSQDPEGMVFADAMTEELIVTLGRIRSLRVISPASVLPLRGTSLSVQEIAEKLGVDAVVEGSVLREEPRIRVNIKLLEPQTGALLWSRSFERDLPNVLRLQRDVALAVAAEIELQLTDSEEASLANLGPVNLEAYDAYLRGRYFLERRTREDLLQAVSLFLEAIRRSPRDARAYVGVADCYALLVPYGGLPPKEAYPQAEAAALRALEFDPSLGEAHASLALVQHEYHWEFAKAEESYRRALRLAPNNARAYRGYGEMLSRLGRHEEALEQIRVAMRLDPLSPILRSIGGWALYNARRYEEAVAQLEEVLAVDGSFAPARSYLGLSLLALGRNREARKQLQEAVRITDGNPFYRAQLGIAEVRLGHRPEAEEILHGLMNEYAGRPVALFHLARLHLALGERESALEELEQALEERGVWMLFLNVDPLLDALRDEPRFQALLRQVGFEAGSSLKMM